MASGHSGQHRDSQGLLLGRHALKLSRMSFPDDMDVARILALLPVRASRTMSAPEYAARVAEVCQLFDIDAVADEQGGLTYSGHGVEREDQPLLVAIRILVAERFGIPEAV